MSVGASVSSTGALSVSGGWQVSGSVQLGGVAVTSSGAVSVSGSASVAAERLDLDAQRQRSGAVDECIRRLERTNPSSLRHSSIDPVNSSRSDGEAAFSWVWAWLHWVSLNKFWDQFMFFLLPRLQHCSLKDNRCKNDKMQPDLDHFLSKIDQHSRLGPKERDWTTRVSSWYSHQQNSIEKSSFLSITD